MTSTQHRIQQGVHFEAPFFDQLLQGREGGRLPREYGAHALWHYYMIAARQLALIKDDMVYEGELSPKFNARAVFCGIAVQHGVTPAEMGKFWECVRQQRMALGLSSNADLPVVYQFKE